MTKGFLIPKGGIAQGIIILVGAASIVGIWVSVINTVRLSEQIKALSEVTTVKLEAIEKNNTRFAQQVQIAIENLVSKTESLEWRMRQRELRGAMNP